MGLQQHCGGSTLCVFRELLPPNTSFSFISRRHRGAPFGLTIYIDGLQDNRISNCCEYKHKPGSKLGGKNAGFSFVGVTGAAPCYRCQVAFTVAQEHRDGKKSKKKRSIESDKQHEKPTSQDEPVDGTPYQEEQDTAISVTILPKGSEQQDDAKDTDNAVADEHENKADQEEA